MKTQHSNVIGPIESSDWKVMRMLKGNINYYSDKKDPKYTSVIEKEKELIKYYLEPYIKVS
jgi:hypothetical protein